MYRILIAALVFVAPRTLHAQEQQGATEPAVVLAIADVQADRERAEASLKAIIATYRSARGVDVATKATPAARKGDQEADGATVSASFRFASDRRAQIKLRDYALLIAGGKIVATHESNALTYLEISDNGSPYYQLFNAFQALPFPELALALGEDDPLEVCMQLMPQIPNVVPIRVDTEETDGQVYDVLVLASDDGSEELRLSFDPDTNVVEFARGVLRSGPNVEPGSELIWKVASKSSIPKVEPTDADFALDVSSRQKVDGLAALIDRRKEAIEDKSVEALKAGDPAPELVLPRVGGGGDWSLAAARPRPVVVDFWATWCGPCIGALPELAKLATEFEGRADVMLVNTGEQGSREERELRIAEVLKKRGVSSLPGVLDLDSMASRRWLVRAFPTTFLVGPDGKIAGVWVGSSPRSQQELREKLEQLCPKRDAPAAPPASK